LGLLSKERWSLSTKPPGRDLLLILLLLLGLVLVRRGWRRVDVFTVFVVLFVVLIDRGLNGCAGVGGPAQVFPPIILFSGGRPTRMRKGRGHDDRTNATIK